MLKVLKTVLPSPEQWEIIVKGTRNPLDSWDKSDSSYSEDGSRYELGEKDLHLMKTLNSYGSEQSKYRRMTPVWMTISAPLYFWKEFDTYKVGTVCNSCSTMHMLGHKTRSKPFTLDDFSIEHLSEESISELRKTIDKLNDARLKYIETGDKYYWWQMIQMLPSSYNQIRTIFYNYEVIYRMDDCRQGHKLDEWRQLIAEFEKLPYYWILINPTLPPPLPPEANTQLEKDAQQEMSKSELDMILNINRRNLYRSTKDEI